MNELKPCPENKSTQLEERLENLTTGINSMFDGQKILVNKAFLEHVRDDMTELLTLRRSQPDNAPLTLEELMTRNKPVWVSVPNASWIPDGGYYALCQNGYITPPTERSFTVEFCVTNGWVFYDRKPEPEGGDRG